MPAPAYLPYRSVEPGRPPAMVDARARADASPIRIDRKGSAVWTGGLKDGKGGISTQSGALNDQPYAFGSRFEGVAGTNPEELLGAAHAACFTMSVAALLGDAGYRAHRLSSSAVVTLEPQGEGFAITAIHLVLRATIAGIDAAVLDRVAQKAKITCPVSKLVSAPITLDARLI